MGGRWCIVVGVLFMVAEEASLTPPPNLRKVKASEQLTVKLDYPYLSSRPNSETRFLNLTSFSKNSFSINVNRY
jgi:hypothetical protein